ncbi:MAG: UDP-N-acetylmuramoyl-L-alanine--D-glutamate ligase [Rickettsiales bacterium]|nr:UDP-N-acetylmuramoyl-L-alanine--D-glutamate ligase [Rickettsiales bacterium]
MTHYLIYGLGKSGVSASKSLSNHSKVTVTDDNSELLNNSRSLLDKKISIKKPNDINYNKIDKVIFAPGIPLFYPKPHVILEKQKEHNFELICDIEAFYQLNKSNNFIGITGTNGKSTTTSLTGHIFKELKLSSNIGGNIGIPIFDLKQNQKNQNYILELSSYQLDLIQELKPNISCLLNITSDHIDRHGSFANYIQSKNHIFKNQSKEDYALINIDDENTKSIFNTLTQTQKQKILPLSTLQNLEYGFSYIGNIITIKTDFLKDQITLEHSYLKGSHNKQNILSSLAITLCHLHKENITMNLETITNSILNFKGLKHRQEFVRSINNINFINDSKATNQESAKKALQSYKNIFLILGGKEKDGISNIINELKKTKKIYLIGESSENFANILQKNSIDFEKNKELNVAIKNAYLDAKQLNNLEEINIVLSPACSSFDQFKHFEERGEYFCKIVNELQKS